DAVLDLLQVAAGVHLVRDRDAERQGVLLQERAVAGDVARRGVTVSNGSQADGRVVLEQQPQPFQAIEIAGLPASRLGFDVARAVAEDAVRLAGLGILFGMAGTAVSNLKGLVDAALLEGQRD